jgi:protocatechuate 4,5-dioxygenase alpha chain
MSLFDIDKAQKGYALNKMCWSLNAQENRAALLADEAGYCARYELNDEERAAVRSRDKAALMAAGGNMYFLAKLDRAPRGEAGK